MKKYNLIEYRDNVVLKTLLQKEDKLFNLTHMVLGMGSELMGELPLALKNHNNINFIEELGDIEFFVVGYAHFENIKLPEKVNISVKNRLIEPLLLLNVSIGNLQTILKKELISGVRKLDGKIMSQVDIAEIVHDILQAIQLIADENHISLEETIRTANARKLNVRYDGGGFTEDNSLNRDSEKEYKALGQEETLRELDLKHGKISGKIYFATEKLTDQQYRDFVNSFDKDLLSLSIQEINKVINKILDE